MKERFILRKGYEQYGWYRRSFEFTALVPLEKSDGAGAFLFTERDLTSFFSEYNIM